MTTDSRPRHTRSRTSEPVLTVCLRSACAIGLIALPSGLAAASTLAADLPPGEVLAQNANVEPTGDALYDGFRNLHARQQWAESEISRLMELSEALQRENQLLRDQLGDLHKRRAETEARAGELGARFVELERGREQALSANLLLQAEKRELEGELESSSLAAAELLRQVETLEATLESKKADFDVRGEEKGKLEEELAQAERRIDELNRELTISQAAQQQYREEIAQLKEAGLREEEKLAQRVLAVDEAIMRAEKAETELASLEAYTSEVNGRVEDLRAALDKAKAESSDLQERLESQGEMQAQALSALEQGGAKLREEGKTLRNQLAAAREKLSELESTRSESNEAMDAIGAENTRLKAGLVELETRLAKADEEAADLKRRLKVLDETHAGAVAAVERLQKDKAEVRVEVDEKNKIVAALRTELEGAKQKIAQEVAVLRDSLAASRREAEELKLELDSVRSRLPAAVGGSVTEDQLRQEAADRVRALRELQKHRGQMEKEAWQEKRRMLETELRDRQFLLAQSLSAHSVYRVQPDDTLAKISLQVYGRAGSWPEIFEANRHLLEDPNRVFPGMSLVIP